LFVLQFLLHQYFHRAHFLLQQLCLLARARCSIAGRRRLVRTRLPLSSVLLQRAFLGVLSSSQCSFDLSLALARAKLEVLDNATQVLHSMHSNIAQPPFLFDKCLLALVFLLFNHKRRTLT